MVKLNGTFSLDYNNKIQTSSEFMTQLHGITTVWIQLIKYTYKEIRIGFHFVIIRVTMQLVRLLHRMEELLNKSVAMLFSTAYIKNN